MFYVRMCFSTTFCPWLLKLDRCASGVYQNIPTAYGLFGKTGGANPCPKMTPTEPCLNPTMLLIGPGSALRCSSHPFVWDYVCEGMDWDASVECFGGPGRCWKALCQYYQLCFPENVVFHSTFNKNVSSKHALSELLHVWTKSEKLTG